MLTIYYLLVTKRAAKGYFSLISHFFSNTKQAAKVKMRIKPRERQKVTAIAAHLAHDPSQFTG